MAAYYNDVDDYCVKWTKNLIRAGLIPDGEVDSRSIRDVQPDDLRGFSQCHFFCGIAGFAYACRLAGWPDDKELWTGGFPCQPFSVAGRQLAAADDRHLWPEMYRLVAGVRPAWVLGENVAGLVKLALDGVLADLDAIRFASRAFVVPACAVDAPHRRDRVWICAKPVADAGQQRRDGLDPLLQPGRPQQAGAQAAGGGAGGPGAVADAEGERRGEMHRAVDCAARGREDARRPAAIDEGYRAVADADEPCPGDGGLQRGGQQRRAGGDQEPRAGGFWDDAGWIAGRDGKARRVEPGIRLLAARVPARVAKLRALGNSICPQVAAEILRAMMTTENGG
jgi:DNA (cytosine-5)-methyltransferase 1